MDNLNKTIAMLHDDLVNNRVTSYELVEESCKKVTDDTCNMYEKKIVKDALKRAKKKTSIDKNKLLDGIPFVLKDNFSTKGIESTASSNSLNGYIPLYDATVYTKLKKAGAILIAKTSMDELAMGGTGTTSHIGPTLNPLDKTRIIGGSSAGSCAAVVASHCPFSIGSDTGDSVRKPASYGGIVGFKPTYGLVSRYGLVAFASSLDQIGPITKDVEDSAILLNIISGHDEKDSTSANIGKKDYTKALKNDVKGLKIGIPKEYFGEGINPEVKEKLEEAIEKYKQLGAIVEDCSLDIADYALATYYIIACAEASSNLGRFDGIRYGYRTKNFTNLKELFKNSRSEGFGAEVKRRIILGTYVLSSGYYDAYYKKAQKVRTLVMNEFNKAFEKYDVILTPTSPTVAFEIGTKSNNPLEMYLADICTVSINIAGLPAISIPCGVNSEGMPIGMQLIGNHFEEETILNAAYTYEQATKFREKYKPEFKGGAK